MGKLDQIDKEIFEMEFEPESKKITDYLNLIRTNLLPIILIFAISLLVTVIYIRNYRTVYRSVSTLKIDKPQSILDKSDNIFMQVAMSERVLSNQIEMMKSYYIRDVVARSLLDSLKNIKEPKNLFLLVRSVSDRDVVPLTQEELRRKLNSIVKIEVKKSVDAVSLSSEGYNAEELLLITNTYSEVYVNYSRELNRQDITNVKKFLEDERQKKMNDLTNSEASLQDFQKRAGYIVLDEQAKLLIENTSRYDAEKNTAEIELRMNENNLNSLKQESANYDPKLAKYIEGQIAEPYIQQLQKQIAELEVKRDIEIANITDQKVKEKIVSTTAAKVESLIKNLDEKVEIMRSGLLAQTPDEKRNLSQKIFEASLYSAALKNKIGILSGFIRKYESEITKLPADNMELAKLQRTMKMNEKLYITLEEKYQEATINERTRFGNATMLEPGFDTVTQIAPNRNLIFLTGTVLGLFLGLSFAFIRNFLDKSIKSPEQLENMGASVLSWIPSFKELLDVHSPETDFVVELKPTSSVSEAFKALRTRIQYSRLEDIPLKTMLVTSTIPVEGKTIVSVNLAGCFAQAGKRTLLLDCDLRKPRVHNIFKMERYPGLSDFLFANVELNEIIRPTKIANLDFITSGTIPPNPSELLGSMQFKNFLEKLKGMYDMLVIDSPPFISVTDSEILFNIIDGTLLVCRANMTPIDAFIKTYKRLHKINPHNLLGCVLNNFSFKSSYGYYYNYYYYYSKPDDKKRNIKNTK
ncbi:MAG: polysaccharide biosynthesis tyrosine autokinase [Ignavibacteriae bacterium]|nr:polysaccharide biosynthesis tyrosine autokinase [Ignavibacteriota bacterium]